MNRLIPATGLALAVLLGPLPALACLPAPNGSLLFAHYRCIAVAERQFDDPVLARSCGAVLTAIVREYDGDPDALHRWELCDVRAAAHIREQAALPDAELVGSFKKAARLLPGVAPTVE